VEGKYTVKMEKGKEETRQREWGEGKRKLRMGGGSKE
jgi:hypothetical protein